MCHITGPTILKRILPDTASTWLIALAICSLAAYLRGQQITIQWLIDDEWHAVHKIQNSQGYLPILTSFGQADYSIPLTLYDRFLADTVGLSELRMRFPMLVAGFAFVVLAMIWARDKLSMLGLAGLGFLLAISPLLVNFSRNARPYMITLLLAGLAIWALAKWDSDGRKRHAAIYLLSAWLASYLHLVMAAFMLAPMAWLFYRRMASGSRRPWPVILLGLGAGALIAAAILPPLLADLSAMTGKTGADLPNADTLVGVWHIWLGTDAIPVVVAGLVFAAIGWQRAWSRCKPEMQLWLFGLAGILAAIYLMRPAWVHNPLTFGRYMLPALPLWLFLIAAGIQAVSERISGRAGHALGMGCLLIFLIGTPHASLLRTPNNFSLHSYHQFDYRLDRSPVREKFSKFSTPSAFWARFANDAPGRYTIAVAGQPSFESYFNLQPLYQPMHRQRLLNLQLSGACADALPGEAFPTQGIHLRNAVSLAIPDDLSARQVEWIVVDRRLEAQMRKARGTTQATAYLDRCERYLRGRFGAPAYADGDLTAFHIGEGKVSSLARVTAHSNPIQP